MPSKEATEMTKIVEAIGDLKTHRAAWRNALVITRNQYEYEGDKSYWDHEIAAFDRTFKALVGE